MQIVLNYKSFLKSSATPMTPLYTGSWNPKFATKWLGVAAELSYNPYLRNGWVSVDTGVKGAVGSPLIEFSTWEAENSAYNIVIPNSFSYRFLFRKDVCVPRFLARSSVEASEWWFLANGSNSILNLWGLKLSPANRVRVHFKAVAYLNYRFKNLNSTVKLGLFGLIPADINNVFGVNESDFRFRDLSINFLYLNKIVQHRIARVRFFLYERGTVASLLKNFRSWNAADIFADQFFFRFLQKRATVTDINNSSLVDGDFRFFNRTPLLFFSFEQLIGNLSTVIFFFLEFKQVPTLVNFFLLLLRRLVERLVFLFAVSLHQSQDLSKAQLVQLSTFIVRRLVNFLLTTYLSTYSFLLLIVHMIREFVIRIRVLGGLRKGRLSFLGGRINNTLHSLYSYKLRQLSASFSANLLFSNKFDAIFLINKIATSALLEKYAKHRGRGLRLFRRKRALFRKKKKFNFVGRWPQNYFYKKRINLADEAVGLTFSRRLYQLRRVFKLSSNGGQFTFLFFWSFQFFNFSQLNLKKRKFFFLAMRLAYFFKSFLRFFKFYAFYFKLLREWDLSGQELYSSNNNFALNLKTYCALLFLKFGRVLVNFKIFCEKIFLLKWKRFCIGSLNDLHNARRALIGAFKLSSSQGTLDVGFRDALFLRKKVPTSLTVKFLAWSYASFTNIYAVNWASGAAVSSRRYLRYLLKLRAMHSKLYVRRVGYAMQSLATENLQNGMSQYLSGPFLSSWFARSFWKLPFLRHFSRAKHTFLKLVARVLSTSAILVFLHNKVLYVKRGACGTICKISPIYIRKLFRRCIARRSFFKPWFFKTLVSRHARSWVVESTDGAFVGRYRKFVCRLRKYSELKFTSVVDQVLKLKSLNISKADNFSLFFVKRVLLAWKTLTRGFLQNWRVQSYRSTNVLFSVKRLLFLFPEEVGRINLLSFLRERSLSIGFRRYSFSEFNPKYLATISSVDAKAHQDQFLVFNLAAIERLGLQAMQSVLGLVGRLAVGCTCVSDGFNSLYTGRGGLLAETLTGYKADGLTSGTFKIWETTKKRKFISANIFLEIWRLYLTVNTWSTGALEFAWGEARLSAVLANLLSFYGAVHNMGVCEPFFALFSACFAYLKVQLSAVRSFSVLRAGILRNELFSNLTNVYLRSYFFRNFFFKKKHSKSVVSESLAAFRLLSVGLGMRALTSFNVLYKLTNWFGESLLVRLGVNRTILPGGVEIDGKYLTLLSPNKTCVYVDSSLGLKRESLDFNSNSSALCSAHLVFLPVVLRNCRFMARSLCAASLPRTGWVFKRAVAARLNVSSRVWRAYRWLNRGVSKNGLVSYPIKGNRVSAICYLKNLLRFVGQATFTANRSGPVGVSQQSYSWRVGKFFNLVRSMHPLKLLVYAKKMGIWPKHLRLRPKKIRQKRVFEINPSKNKQSLVPDKNFKMPPSIFSRDNYDSMNLILDFPNEDYRFAKVNTYKWVRAWRFTRNLAARKLIVFIKRRLKIRYFKRTFRYRRFLRKRRFRNKLKKIAYRAIIRASVKLRALRSLKIVYRGGTALRYFSVSKLHYSPILTHSLVVARFFKGLHNRFLGAKVTLRLNFMRVLKLQFLFLLSVSFFKKMVSFFASFTWAYRMTFAGEVSFAWCFNKLNSLLLAAIRMYSLGASYYWTEPLALFNTKLLFNYTEEGFFNVRRLPDFFVIRTIGPTYYPYHTLIASLPWRTDNTQLFQPYNTFLMSALFNTTISRFVFGAMELRVMLENFNIFNNLLEGEFFQTCGFRMHLPVRRRGGNSIVLAKGIKVYLKPTRRAQIVRLIRKLVILRARHKSEKKRLSLVRESRNSVSTVDYIDNSRSFFKSLLRLRPIYITLPKYGVASKYYRMWCRVVRVIANAHRLVRPARLNVVVNGEFYFCRTTRRYIRHRRTNFRFGKHRVRMHWRQRKFFARRGVAVNLPSVLEKTRGNGRINARLSRRKQPTLFSR